MNWNKILASACIILAISNAYVLYKNYTYKAKTQDEQFDCLMENLIAVNSNLDKVVEGLEHVCNKIDPELMKKIMCQDAELLFDEEG